MEEKKITFTEFTKEFPYAFLLEREPQYVERVSNFLNQYPKDQHSLIMDLLDLQWVAFVQQLWSIGDETGSFDHGPNHAAVARLEINSDIRRNYGLPDRNMRSEMFRHENDVLTTLENAE